MPRSRAALRPLAGTGLVVWSVEQTSEKLCVRHTRVLFVLGCVLSKSLGLFRVISVKEPFFVGLISGEKNHSLNHDLLVNHGLEAKKS